MIVVIQCAATKRRDAGYLRQQGGTKVLCVAHPTIKPTGPDCVHAHPDDLSDTGDSWREKLVRYNANPGANPLGLLRAFELYEDASYRALVERFGAARTYILSAGWGLISASFLTPAYDITFNTQTKKKAPWKFRHKKRDHYDDLCHLPADTVEPVIFFGGKDYVPLFCKLTAGITAKRTIFFNANEPPKAPGCALKPSLPTRRKMNWHYECVDDFINDRISADT
jgi:hypothetical protein